MAVATDRRQAVLASALRAGNPASAPNGAAYDHRFIASTELLATDGGVILLTAWDLSEYVKRPVFLDQHDIYSDRKLSHKALGKTVCLQIEDGLPIADVGPTGRALVIYVKFGSTEYGQEVKSLYDDAILNDVSVRWNPENTLIRAPYAGEAAIYGPDVQWVCEYAQMIEVSAVLFGADPGAQQVRVKVEAALARAKKAAGREKTPVKTPVKKDDATLELPEARGPSGDKAAATDSVTNTAASGESPVGSADAGVHFPRPALTGEPRCDRCETRCCADCQTSSGERTAASCDGSCCDECAGQVAGGSAGNGEDLPGNPKTGEGMTAELRDDDTAVGADSSADASATTSPTGRAADAPAVPVVPVVATRGNVDGTAMTAALQTLQQCVDALAQLQQATLPVLETAQATLAEMSTMVAASADVQKASDSADDASSSTTDVSGAKGAGDTDPGRADVNVQEAIAEVRTMLDTMRAINEDMKRRQVVPVVPAPAVVPTVSAGEQAASGPYLDLSDLTVDAPAEG